MKRLIPVTAAVALSLLVLASERRTASGSSSPPNPSVPDSLAPPTGPGSGEPFLAVGPDGRVYLSWLEPAADSGFAFRMSSFDGRVWGPARTIRAGADFFVNWADFPSVQPLGRNQLAAHWLQRTGRTPYAYGVRIVFSADAGATWSGPITPHRDTSPQEHGFVAMWRDGSRLAASWLDGRKFTTARSPSNEMMVATTTLDSTGRLSDEVMVDTRVCDCCQTSAAVTSTGPIIAYRDRSPDEIRDIYVVRRVKGTWTAPAPVHNDGWKIAACPVNGPSVDATGDRVALAWFTAANEKPAVKLAFSTDGGARFGNPIRIDDGNPAGRVDVAALSDGSALVTWIERTGGDTASVRLRRVDRRGRTGSSITIAASSAARASGFPRMVVAGDHVMFAWTVPGRPSIVRAARLPLASIR